MKVLVYTIMSDSGDRYPPLVYKKVPSRERLERDLRKTSPGDFVETANGPGDFGSNLFTDKYKVELVDE